MGCGQKMAELDADVRDTILVESTFDDSLTDASADAQASSASARAKGKTAATGSATHAEPKPNTSWFGKVAKHCSKCGKASVKVIPLVN